MNGITGMFIADLVLQVLSYVVQREMPMSVRERYEKMLAASIRTPNLEGMVENFDKDLSHPNETDLI